jgi:hypothetical protein
MVFEEVFVDPSSPSDLRPRGVDVDKVESNLVAARLKPDLLSFRVSQEEGCRED